MLLVERDEALATLGALAASARTQGRVVLITGEAGIGKTSVLRAAATQHAAAGRPVWWGACDALQTPHPLAPLADIAHDGAPRLAPLLAGPRPALFDAALDELRRAGPVLVVIEDAHWADDATLDLLTYLGRRIARTTALLAISYRDDEVNASHPLRRVLGELPPAHRSVLVVPRLSRGAVEEMARRAGHEAGGLFAATHGNAFFVTEVLREPASSVPRSVQDVVLARVSRLPASAQALLRLVALVPGRVENRLVEAVAAPSFDDLDVAVGSGLLVAEAQHLAYRHELARVAVEASVPPPIAQTLHSRLLQALSSATGDVPAARLVHHAAAAADWAAVGRLAPAAAREATTRGARREAAAQWRLALEHGQATHDAEREQWLESSALENAAIGRTHDALQARRELEQRARERGDVTATALQIGRQALLHIQSMQHDEADRLSRQAIAMLAPLPPGPAHATVWRSEAYLRMLARDNTDSVTWAERAMALSQSIGDAVAAAEARGSLGTALLFIDYPRGVQEMLGARQAQRAAGNLVQAIVLTSNLGSGSGEVMQLANAERWLLEALEQGLEHELDALRNYVRSWLALTSLLRGRWDESAGWADQVVRRDGVSPMSRLMALLALGRLRGRRGDPGVAEALDAGLTLTGEHNTLQRIAPLRVARAEAAFLRGDFDAVRSEVDSALPLALAKHHGWFAGELAYWRWRADGMPVDVVPPAVCAAPWALELQGRWADAAQTWQDIGCPYERARALALGDDGARREALATFEALGARPAADALRRDLRDTGARGVQRGPRASTRAQPCGLTGAELRVLQLLAAGLRNADVAARLHRSVRTVDHHVAAVLAKLEVDSRHAAVERARREGWLPMGGPT